MPSVVAGPAWSVRADSPDDRGRFPLGVEAVTLAHAAALAPGVTAGTTHGRYYALHARIAAEVARSSTAGRTMSLATARDLIRGSEVILGAISVRHFESAPDQHQALSQPHAEAVLGPALARAGSNGSLQIADLAKSYSRQVSGFHTVYRGAEIVLGLIQQPQLPQPGKTRFTPAALSIFDPILDLATTDTVAVSTLDAFADTHCLCRIRGQQDGTDLRGLLFGVPESPNVDIRSVRARMRITTSLLVQALSDRPISVEPVTAMEDLLCFSTINISDELTARVAERWQGALLRNHLVTAWRRLWRDVTDRLPATAAGVAQHFAEACVIEANVGGSPQARAVLLDGLVRRQADGRIADTERALIADNTPLNNLRMLALASLRADDLSDRARAAYLTSNYADTLGPRQTSELLERHLDGQLYNCAFTVADFMITRAQQVSARRSRWDSTGLHLPTRLRPIGEILTMAGQEGNAPASLRLERLTHLCLQLGVLAQTDGRWQPGPFADVVQDAS